MAEFQKFPDKYIPEFFHTIISQINDDLKKISKNILSQYNKLENTSKDIYDRISDEEKECLKRSSKISEKLECIEKEIYNRISDDEKNSSIKISQIENLFHDIDKEIFKVKELYKAVTDQSKLNVGFSEQFRSMDYRLKWLFRICIILLCSLISLSFFLIKSWLGGRINV